MGGTLLILRAKPEESRGGKYGLRSGDSSGVNPLRMSGLSLSPLIGEMSRATRVTEGFWNPFALAGSGTSPTGAARNKVTHPPTPLPRKGHAPRQPTEGVKGLPPTGGGSREAGGGGTLMPRVILRERSDRRISWRKVRTSFRGFFGCKPPQNEQFILVAPYRGDVTNVVSDRGVLEPLCPRRLGHFP